MTILEFLREYQEELFSERIEYKEELDLINTRLLEDRKFVDVLLSTNESYFSELSPRNLNEKNNEKAAEVKESIKKQEEQQSIVEEKLSHIDLRLSQIKKLIEDEIALRILQQKTETKAEMETLSVKEDNENINVSQETLSSDNAEKFDNNNADDSFDKSVLINKLSIIKSYIKVDNNRAVMDLDLLIKSLK